MNTQLGAQSGARRWATAGRGIPESSSDSGRTSNCRHTFDGTAQVTLVLYCADRGPAVQYQLAVRARHTLHLRFNALEKSEPLPRARDCACAVESDVQPALASPSTSAFTEF